MYTTLNEVMDGIREIIGKEYKEGHYFNLDEKAPGWMKSSEAIEKMAMEFANSK